MVLCAVVNCSNRSVRDSHVSYFSFPRIIDNKGIVIKEKTTARRNEWLARISRADLNDFNLKHKKVCSEHFIQGKPSSLFDETNPDWAPSLRLGHSKHKVDSNQASERYARACQRNSTPNAASDCGDNQLPATSPCHTSDMTVITNCITKKSVAVQTDCTMQYIAQLEEETQSLREEKNDLEKKSCDFSEKIIMNDEKVQFYTGLPSGQVLNTVYDFISPRIKYKPLQITRFQSFLLFLLRLRLNLLFQDLAYRFLISQATAGRIFDVWLEGAFLSMSSTIIWPERNSLRQTMPTNFKMAFGTSVAVIVDCFEIMIDRPNSLVTRAATWSNYKHHNTVKVLIGISPQGAITFISEAWGGRVSDKYITENCGILEKLLPGDYVMADRGFNIGDSVGFYCAKLIKPASARGKTQLSPKDIKQTRELASLRIHVERVIGNLRQKYSILKGQLSVECLMSNDEKVPTVDKIIKVCSAFTNLSNSVVSLN